MLLHNETISLRSSHIKFSFPFRQMAEAALLKQLNCNRSGEDGTCWVLLMQLVLADTIKRTVANFASKGWTRKQRLGFYWNELPLNCTRSFLKRAFNVGKCFFLLTLSRRSKEHFAKLQNYFHLFFIGWRDFYGGKVLHATIYARR